MDEVYIRKLYDQELGYRGGAPGQAGRYIFISKLCLSFFPPLSNTILNDKLFLKIVPSFSNNVVYAVYVYHNDSYFGRSRDEYRLYLNKELDPDADFYKSNDIILLQKFTQDDGSTIYKIYYFPVNTRDEKYEYLEKILNSSPIKGGNHALVSIKSIPFIDDAYKEPDKIIIPNEVKDEALKQEPILLNEPQQKEMIIEDVKEYPSLNVNLIRSTSFRDLVLFFYNYKCAVSKTSISYKDLINLEAAHIQPDSHLGPLHPTNGIALNRDLHWAFDKGFFTITNEYKVIVHKEVTSEPLLNVFNNIEIIIPEDSRARPKHEYIEYHNKNIFGLFLSSGVIRFPGNS